MKNGEIYETPDYWRERTVFPGNVPKDVKILLKNISSLDKQFFRKLIKVALGYIQETATSDQCETAFENLCKLCGCQTEDEVLELSNIYAGVISLLRAVLKINLKTVRQDTLSSDLKELGFPEAFAADVCKVIFGPAYPGIFNSVLYNSPHLDRLTNFEWKVEPVVYNSESGKIVKPFITMNMKTCNGQSHSFEVPVSAFHLLRQSTAALLRQMEFINRKK